ncbi:MAG: Bifunctional NAD(P)H-hydrate repair enzyme [Pedosphaera sp.]|nr:Bifunctional NAD(P)H-hydrate repair enzyme [Pedosphaera sp.]
MPMPVISVGQMREWEKTSWASGKNETEVIERVGQIIARRISQLTSANDLILILAGKGHNGDDARQSLKHLPNSRVHLQNITDPQNITETLSLLDQRPSLIVDGLFGIGINRPLDAHWTALIQRINELQTRVLSIDVPSGLNADTGKPEGAAIQASITLTLGAPKQGLLMPAALPYVGQLEVAPEIGLVKSQFTSETIWTLPGDFEGFPPARSVAAHKGDFGRLAIIAGSIGYHGAAVLASRGSQRAQPGLITLYTQEVVYHSVAPQLQAVMVSIWQSNIKLPGNFNAILIGPGLAAEDLSDEMKMTTRHLWRGDAPLPIVVDASALDWLPMAPLPKNVIRVITPHPGEAARLLRISAQQVQANRPQALRELSRRLGNCWVVLKGHQTLIGRSTGEIYINPSGNPHLAQGGSGDVLSGYLAGLLAQPALQADPLKTIRYAVWQHGATADRLNLMRRNWVVEDLITEIGNTGPMDEECSPSQSVQK